MRRQHVVWQAFAQVLAQLSRTHRLGTGSDQVGHQAHIARHGFACNDNGFAQAGVRQQRGLDLAEFDAVAADLDLVVEPAEKLDDTVATMSGEITGAVDTTTRGAFKRMRQKAFGRQFGKMQVPAHHTLSADDELARDTDWNGLLARVEDIDRLVGQWPSDRDRRFIGVDGMCGRPDRGLRRAIHVHHLTAGNQRRQFAGQRRREGFAADHQAVQRRQSRPRGVIRHQHARHRRRALQVGDVVLPHQRGQRVVGRGDPRRQRQSAQFVQVGQVFEHHSRIDAEVDQAGDVVDADGLDRVDHRQTALGRTEQAAALVVALERMLEQRVHLVLGQTAQVNRTRRGVHALAALEGRERPGVLLDQVQRAAQILDQRLSHLGAHLRGIGSDEAVQHQRHVTFASVAGIVPGLAVRAELVAQLADGLAQQVGQHVSADASGGDECFRVAG